MTRVGIRPRLTVQTRDICDLVRITKAQLLRRFFAVAVVIAALCNLQRHAVCKGPHEGDAVLIVRHIIAFKVQLRRRRIEPVLGHGKRCHLRLYRDGIGFVLSRRGARGVGDGDAHLCVVELARVRAAVCVIDDRRRASRALSCGAA